VSPLKIKIPVKNLRRQRCAERFNSGAKRLKLLELEAEHSPPSIAIFLQLHGMALDCAQDLPYAYLCARYKAKCLECNCQRSLNLCAAFRVLLPACGVLLLFSKQEKKKDSVTLNKHGLVISKEYS
jgi:hypothetical protein